MASLSKLMVILFEKWDIWKVIDSIVVEIGFMVK